MTKQANMEPIKPPTLLIRLELNHAGVVVGYWLCLQGSRFIMVQHTKTG
jgi:hypothetical protein